MKMSTIIIILLIVSLLFFIAVGTLIYLNRGGEQMISITIKSLLIPVLAGAGLMLIEFVKPLKNYKEELHLGLVDDPMIMMSLNNKTDVGLNEGIMQYSLLLSRVKNDNSEIKLEEEEIEYFIQVYIINLLASRYRMHWDIDYNNQNWFFESGRTVISAKRDAEKKPKKILISDLQNEYDKHPFLTKMDGKRVIFLPKNSKIILGNKFYNLLEIETDNIRINVSIENISYAYLPHNAGETADKFRRKLGMQLGGSDLISFYGVSLVYNIEPKRVKRWSPKTLKELEWAEGTFKNLKELISWEKFKAHSN